MRTNVRRKVAFINLPDSRLDVFSRVTDHMEFRAEVAIHVDISATVIKMADLLQVPTSTQMALLRRFPCQIIVVPDDRPDLKVEVAEFAGDPPALVLTVSEMAARLGVESAPNGGPPPSGESGWHIPLSGASRTLSPASSATTGSTTPRVAAVPESQAAGEPTVRTLVLPPSDREPAHPMLGQFDTSRQPRNPAVDEIAELQATLSLSGDKQDLLQRILQLAVGSVRGDAGSIMLLDGSGEFLRIAVAVGLSHEVLQRTRQRIGEGVAGSVMLEGRGRILQGKLRDPRYRSGRERTAIQCAISVPICVGDQPIGVLNVSSDGSHDALNEKDKEKLEKFGVEMASVVLKAMEPSGQEDLTLEASLKKQIDHRMVLLEPLDQRLQELARLIGSQYGGAICRIYVLDGTGRRLLPLGVHDPGALAPAAPCPARSGLIGWVFQRQEAETFLPRTPGPDHRGLLLVPFRGEDPIGLIELEEIREDLVGDGETAQCLARVAYHLGQYIEAERATRVMARRSRQIMHLSDLAVEMLGEVSLEILIDMALASAAGLFDADLAALRLYPDNEVTYSDPELAERETAEMQQLLRFDTALAETAKHQPGILNAENLPAALGQELTAQPTVRWVAAMALPGPAGPLGVLTLYGLSEESVELAPEEHDVLGRFCGYLVQGLTQAICDQTEFEFPDRFIPWESCRDRVMELARERGTVGLTVVSIERFGALALEMGRGWAESARETLHGFLYRTLGPGGLASQIRDGRYALLVPDSGEDPEGLSGILLDAWPNAAAGSGLDGFSRLSFSLETYSYPRDCQNLEEFLDIVADRFGNEEDPE